MSTATNVIHGDPDIFRGERVFIGTRVPLQNLIDYLAAGDSLETFLGDASDDAADFMAFVATQLGLKPPLAKPK